MKKRTAISIILGTLILFIWNAVSWMALPFHTSTLKNVPEGLILAEEWREAMPESGIYHFPGMHAELSDEDRERVDAIIATGPRVPMMVYVNEPTELFDPVTFVYSLLTNLATVILLIFVISRLKVKNFKTILVTSFAIGLLAAFLSDISQMVWFMYPWDYTLVNLMDKVVALGLVGILFATYTYKKAEE